MKTIQNVAAIIFIWCVAVLALVCVLGVWNVFETDVIIKSFETLGLLAVVAVIVIAASRYIGDPSVPALPEAPMPGFRSTRNLTLGVLIVSAVGLAFLGVMSIWGILADKEVLHRSLSTLAIIAFSSLIIVLVCLEREKNELWQKRGKELSTGGIVIAFIFFWIFIAFFN
jgi:hypothetical protein